MEVRQQTRCRVRFCFLQISYDSFIDYWHRQGSTEGSTLSGIHMLEAALKKFAAAERDIQGYRSDGQDALEMEKMDSKDPSKPRRTPSTGYRKPTGL